MKYLKKFNQASEYEAFKVGDEYITPNVSYVVDESEVKFGSAVKPLVYNMVDLGLPSGLLWADRNVGATSPEDTGLYFQWGDTVGWTIEQLENGEKVFGSDFSDYFDTTDGGNTFNKYNKSGLTTLEASDDAATVHMGSEYRMPTEIEMQELIDNCTITFIDLQGNEHTSEETNNGAIPSYNLKSVKFTGSNGNSIFMPAVGEFIWSNHEYVYDLGCLWSSSLNSKYNYYALKLFLYSTGYCGINDSERSEGIPVRGVCNK